MTTIETLVNFVVNNRKGKAFDGWTPIQLAQSFLEAVGERMLLFSEKDGVVDGVIHCIRFGNTIHVVNVLTTRRGVLKSFVRRFVEMYPGHELSGERNGRLKQYNTKRLVELLTTN